MRKQLRNAADAAWERFEHSGAVLDYLDYRRAAESGRLTAYADQNTGIGAQTAEHRGK